MSRKPSFPSPVIPSGSTILVTGANGLLGSHCVDQALAAGYKVRATVRDAKRCSWMNELFDKRYTPGLLELAEVPDVYKDGYLDEAVKGVAAVIHTVPSDADFVGTDPAPGLRKETQTVVAALQSAKKEETIKRFVLTSSAWAASAPKPNTDYYVDEKCWNDDAIKAAWRKDPPPTGFDIFMAIKTQAEQAAWKWVEDNQPKFVMNTILPDTVMGYILAPDKQTLATTGGMLKVLYDGKPAETLAYMKHVAPQWYIDSGDTGRLHVIAAIDPDVENERILGHAGQFSWDIILAMLREKFPDKTFVEDFKQEKHLGRVANDRGNELLKKHYQQGWKSLSEVVDETLRSYEDI